MKYEGRFGIHHEIPQSLIDRVDSALYKVIYPSKLSGFVRKEDPSWWILSAFHWKDIDKYPFLKCNSYELKILSLIATCFAHNDVGDFCPLTQDQEKTLWSEDQFGVIYNCFSDFLYASFNVDKKNSQSVESNTDANLYDIIRGIPSPSISRIAFEYYSKTKERFDNKKKSIEDLKESALTSITQICDFSLNRIDEYENQIKVLQNELKDLRLKVAQYEEDKRKSIPKGVAKAVTFNSILNYIESCRNIEEARPCEYMLFKLMTLGECDKKDFVRLQEAMEKVQNRETRNVNNNYNGPIINNGTLNGDVNNKQDKQDEQ